MKDLILIAILTLVMNLIKGKMFTFKIYYAVSDNLESITINRRAIPFSSGGSLKVDSADVIGKQMIFTLKEYGIPLYYCYFSAQMHFGNEKVDTTYNDPKWENSNSYSSSFDVITNTGRKTIPTVKTYCFPNKQMIFNVPANPVCENMTPYYVRITEKIFIDIINAMIEIPGTTSTSYFKFSLNDYAIGELSDNAGNPVINSGNHDLTKSYYFTGNKYGSVKISYQVYSGSKNSVECKGIITVCYENCKTCKENFAFTTPLESSQDCLTCKPLFALHRGTKNCYEIPLVEVNDTKYYDIDTGYFEDCRINCDICTNKKSCSVCKTGSFRAQFPLPSTNFECLSTKPTDYFYLDTETGSYMRCGKDCKKCTVEECVTCVDPPHLIKPEVIFVLHVDDAKNCKTMPLPIPQGYFYNAANNKIQLCKPECKECIENSTKCLSCGSKHYFIEGESPTQCFNYQPSLFYYKADDENYKKCYKYCRTCSKEGFDDNHQNCDSCIDLYALFPPLSGNCIPMKFPYKDYYYLDMGYTKKYLPCAFPCKKCDQAGDFEKHNCLECKPGLGLVEGDEGMCLPKNIQMEGYIYDNDKEKYYKCFPSCYNCFQRGIYYKQNCLSCRPNFLMLPSDDCIDISEIGVNSLITDVTLFFKPNCSAEAIRINVKDYGYSFYSLGEQETLPAYIPRIYLNECEGLLREYHKIPPEDMIYIGQINANDTNIASTHVDFKVYSNIGKELSMDCCQNVLINISKTMDIKRTTVDYEQANFLKEMDYDFFNPLDPFYNNPCVFYATEDNRDTTLDNRRRYIYPNITICEIGCSYNVKNYEVDTVVCTCTYDIIMAKNVNDFFTDDITELLGNFDLFACGKVFLRINVTNAGLYIGVLVILTEIILSIVYCAIANAKILKPMKERSVPLALAMPPPRKGVLQGFVSLSIKESGESISYKKRGNNNEKGNKGNSSHFISVNNDDFNERMDNYNNPIDVKNIEIIDFDERPKKKKMPKIKDYDDKQEEEEEEEEEDEREEEEENDYYNKNYLNNTPIPIQMKQNQSKNKNLYSSNSPNSNSTPISKANTFASNKDNLQVKNEENREDIKPIIYSYSPELLNILPLSSSIIQDNRSFFKCFINLFTVREIILSLILLWGQCYSILTRLILFFFNLSTIIFLNSFLFTNNQISERFTSDTPFSLTNIITKEYLRSIIAALIALLTSKLVFLFTSSEAVLSYTKENIKERREYELRVEQIVGSLKNKTIIMSIIVILMSIVYYYFIIIFCYLHQNNQVGLFISTAMSLLYEIAFQGVLCVIICCLRFTGLCLKNK